ncbi:hypothetical protein K490DRAFT_63174 [Saccharata proteae CBS 121410]|uniref:Bromo domain-containing protein n=1 Tax=Saccharata proteae CBS 121410 TaxID=1314787 RepID=A0A9P4HYR6_9PEZI|nr:hypothetical protein K490DRAFT_63174 [Saccharata proteae CBS 121410]
MRRSEASERSPSSLLLAKLPALLPFPPSTPLLPFPPSTSSPLLPAKYSSPPLPAKYQLSSPPVPALLSFPPSPLALGSSRAPLAPTRDLRADLCTFPRTSRQNTGDPRDEHHQDAQAAVTALAPLPLHRPRRHPPHHPHSGGMSSPWSQYSPLESLLLFQSLACYGVDLPAFARISDVLNSNPSVRDAPTYDSRRLSPDALRELYLGLLKEELKEERQDPKDPETVGHNGDTSPSRKRKPRSPSLPSVQDAVQHAHLLPRLITKLYMRYRQHAIEEIRFEERKYDQLRREIEEIERGDWDEHLRREASRNGANGQSLPVDGNVPRPAPNRITGVKLFYSNTAASSWTFPGSSQSSAVYQNRGSHQPSIEHAVQWNNIRSIASHLSHFMSIQGYHYLKLRDLLTTWRLHMDQHIPVPHLDMDPHHLKARRFRTPISIAELDQDRLCCRHLQECHFLQLPSKYHRCRKMEDHFDLLRDRLTSIHGLSHNQDSSRPQGIPNRICNKGQGTSTRSTKRLSILRSIHKPRHKRNLRQPPNFPLPHPANRMHPRTPRPPPIHIGTPLGSWKKGLPQPFDAMPPPEHNPAPVSPISPPGSPVLPKRESKMTKKKAESVAKSKDMLAPDVSARTVRGTRKPTRKTRAGSNASSAVTGSVRGRTRSQSVASHAEESASDVKADPGTPAGTAESDIQSTTEATPTSGARTRRRAGTIQSTTSQTQEKAVKKRKRGTREPSETAEPDQRGNAERVEDSLGPPTTVIASRNFNRMSVPVMNDITSHKHASLFSNPVKAKDAEGYYDIIRRPQDLKSIRAAITSGSRAVAAATASTADTPSANSPGPQQPQQKDQPSTPNASASTGTHITLPISEDLVPPKGIVNSAQLEKELMRMFANAVMFNTGDEGVVGDAVEMAKDVESSVANWRAAERTNMEVVEEAEDIGVTSAAGGGGKRRKL